MFCVCVVGNDAFVWCWLLLFGLRLFGFAFCFVPVSCLAVCVLFWVGCGGLFGGFLLIVLMFTVLCCVVWLCWWFL